MSSPQIRHTADTRPPRRTNSGTGSFHTTLQSLNKQKSRRPDTESRRIDGHNESRRLDGGHIETTLASSGEPEGLPACEDFEIMIDDLSRIYAAWATNSRAGFNSVRQDCLNQKRQLDADRAKMIKEIDDMRRREEDKIKENRLRAEQELAVMAKQVAAERENARHRISEERKKLELERQTLQQTLRIEQDRLRRELDALDRERNRITDANIATQTMVEVNVGGVIFETARSVLQQMPESYLAALFSGRHEVERDRNGRIFIDRDAGLFSQIINFLRDPTIPIIPADEAASNSIAREAQFYGIRFYPYPLVHVLGGNDGVDYLRSVEVLDLNQQCWRACATLETARAYFASGVVLNRLYAAGGQNFEYKALCDVESYDILRDCWLPGPSLLTPRKSAFGAVLDGRFYVGGGFDGFSILDSVEVTDPRVRGWMSVAPLTTPRSSAMCVGVGDQLMVLGGSCGERLRSVEVYEPRMDKWTLLDQEMMEVRSGGSAATVFESVLVMGGIDGGQRVHDSVEVSELGQSWSYRKPMSKPRVDGSACEVSSSVVITGGQAYGEVSGDVEFYRPELDVWQPGPALMSARFGHQIVAALI